jgi:SAM-dependent methyltransferase
MNKTYSLPHIYDIAFDFRDVKGEVDFLLKIAGKHLKNPVRSAIELACGPAYHAREMARRGVMSDAIDLSPEMVAYTRELVAKEKLSAEIRHGDMRSFLSEKKYDLAYILISSFAHLLTNQDILDNFNCVVELLNPGGVYVIVTAHPKDFWKVGEPYETTHWTMERDGIVVITDWGGDNEKFDPLTEIDDVTISFSVTKNSETTVHKFPEKLRRLSFQTFNALIQLSGRLEVVDLFGDFDESVPFSNDKESGRMVAVLRKK